MTIRLLSPASSCDRQLADAVQKYVLWMKQNGYSAYTISSYERLLKHFQNFIHKQKVSWDTVLTYGTLQKFKKDCPLFMAGNAVRGLGRYLSRPLKPPRRRMGDIYEDYLVQTDRPVPSRSVNRVTKLLLRFESYLLQNVVSLNRLRIEHVDRFIAQYSVGYSYATCRHIRHGMRGFLKYLYDRGVIKRDLASLVVGPVEFARSKPPKFLKPDELTRLFDRLKSTDNKDMRTIAMVHLAYLLGLRPQEVARIRLNDIRFAESHIRINDRKSTNPVRLPLPEATIKAVAAYVVAGRPKTEHRELFINCRPPFGPVTPATVCHDVTKVLKSINPAASAYWLRHTYAQNMLESGASIFELKEMMGHDSIQSTRRYLTIHTELMREVLFDETL